MDELFGCFISRCNEQKSITFCGADYDPSHRIVSLGVNSVRMQTSAVMADLTWQQYLTGIIFL
jgi:hypothetical protein